MNLSKMKYYNKYSLYHVELIRKVIDSIRGSRLSIMTVSGLFLIIISTSIEDTIYPFHFSEFRTMARYVSEGAKKLLG